MRLIDADVLYKQLQDAEELARNRVLDTESSLPFPTNLNPSYTRYSTQLDERTRLKHMVADAPTINPQPRWIPCSEYPEYDFEGVLVRWHDKRKGCEDEYTLCEGYVVRKHWCCIFEDADMSEYEPVEWAPISQRRMNHDLLQTINSRATQEDY